MRKRGSLGVQGRVAALFFLAVLFAVPAMAANEDRQEAEIQFSRGLYALNAGDAHEAYQRFEAAHLKAPEEGRYLFYFGLAENRLRRYRKALEHLQQAQGLEPGIPGLPFEMGLAHMGIEEWEAARENLREARKRQPRRGEVYMQLGVVEAGLGNTSEALTLFDKALALDPGLEDQASFHKGRTYLQAGMVDRARDEFQEAAASRNMRITSLSDDYLGRIEVAEAGPPDRWDFVGYFAAGYDTNVLLFPDDPGTGIPSDKEDYRAVLYGSVKYRPWMGRRGMFGIGLGLYQSLYDDLSEFDLTGVLPEIEFRWWDDSFSLRALAYYANYQLDWDDYMESGVVEVRPGWRQRNSGRTEFVVRYSDNDYEFDPRDSTRWAVGVEQWFYPWRTKQRQVSAYLEYANNDSSNDFERVERKAGISFFSPMGPAWDFHLGFHYADFDYENVDSFFQVVRQDTQWEGVIRCTYDLKKWLALVIEYRATDHPSNIDFYDYDRQMFSIGILARP